jgi:hypothetical protein
MAIRRFNYTGRTKIKLEDSMITILSENGKLEFDAQLSLDEYKFSSDARIFIEAYRQTSFMRFDCGKIGRIKLPADRGLHEFDYPEGILFRIRVTSPDEPEGLLIGEADQIRPGIPDQIEQETFSLLPVKSDDSLGDQIFRVDFSDYPILLINSQLGDWRSVCKAPVFISLAYPDILRQILVYILQVDEYTDTEDPQSWRSQWLRLASSLPSVGSLSPEDDAEMYEEWIESAVSSFCRKFRVTDKFMQYWIGEGA